MNDYQIVSLVPNAEIFGDWLELVAEAKRLDDNAAMDLLSSVEESK